MMGASPEATTTTATAARATGVAEEEKESSGITIEVLQQHFHQPLMAVADELGVSLTMIKRLCRKLGMPRWPFRQIDSINKAMEDLHDQLEGARTEADRARYCKALEDAEKKKQLITRGAAAGVDPNVRNALYLADTANVSEDDIFGNPELMSKLSDALKTITKRKRVKGKPLVDLIATVQRDGSLPACVQASNGTAPQPPSARSTAIKPVAKTGADAAAGAAASGSSSSSSSTSTRSSGGCGGASRRQIRPPAIVDAIATSNEEYAANIEHAYGSVQHPESSASDTTSVSPALSSLGNSAHGSSAEDYAHHGWGHNSSTSVSQQHHHQQQQQQQHQHQYGARSQGSTPVSASAKASRAQARAKGEGFSHDALLDSPASSCATLVAGSSPGPGERPFSPGGGSMSGRFSPAAAAGGGSGVNGTAAAAATGVVLQQPPSFAFRPTGAAGTPSGGGAGYPHGMGQRQPSPAGGHRPRPKERLSITSSVASTDIESLDTSHLLEFDDDDDDETVPYGGPGYAAPAGDLGCVPPAAGSVGSGSGAAGAAGGAGNRVSPEDLQELEEALLMDNFSGVMDGILEGEVIPSAVPKMEALENMNFSGLFNSGAQPLTRGGGHVVNSGPSIGAGVPRGTPRSAGAAGSPRVQMFGGRSGASPNHAAGSASPVGTATAGGGGGGGGPPRPGPRGMGRPRSSQVPPRPYTPGKSSRGGLWLAQGLQSNSPRVGSSPRPPTPGTPGTHATAPGGGGGSGSGSGRRRGDEAFPVEHYAPSPKDPLGSNGLMGGPSPKSRRVGARGFPERFPGSPQAGLSPHVGFPPQSPLSGGGAAAGAGGSAGFNVTCSPLGGSDRTYFPAPAASAKAAALADPSSGRGHRRSSSSGLSSGWGSGPRHSGVGESGFDPCATASSGPSAAAAAAAAAVAAAAAGAAGSSAAMSAGFQASATAASSSGQSWSVRLGDGTKQHGVTTAPKPAHRQNGWVLSSGEGQQQQQQQQQQGTKSRSCSPSISANGPPQQRLPRQQSASSRPKSHGVVRRRHSAPIPPVQTFPVASGAGEFAGEDIMGMSSAACSSAIKMEFQAPAGSRQPLEGIGAGGSGGGSGCGDDVLESFSTNYFGAATGTGAGAAAGAAAAGKWGGAALAPAATKMGEAEGAWWQQRQAGEGGMLLETSATAAPAPATEMPGNCEFETTFDDSAGCDDLMDAHVMTATLPVDL